MKSLWISLALIAAFTVADNLPISAQSPEQLYQKGLMKEEGEGALQDAIDLYSQIADNENADQSLRAKALLHIGMCYEKMGTQEAVKAYQRLVNNFPAQQDEVAIATERLNRLLLLTEAKPEILPTPQWTKIKIPTKLSWSVCLSPDGKDLALISDKKLWVMPLKGNLGPDIPGTPQQLNTGGIEVEWTGLSWSRDGKWIAFNEYPRKDDQGNAIEDQCIYMVPSEGGVPKKLIENYRDWRVVNYRISLTPDGKDLAFSSVEDNKQHIYTISTDGGDSTRIINSQAREPVFSPDGRLIAYVEDKNLGRGQGDLGLWVIPAKGGTPVLVANAGMASSPVWAPDGRMIAFLDNSKEKQINIIPVSQNGSATGNVSSIPVPEGVEEVRLLAGWTPDHKIGALMVSNQEFGLFTLPATGGQAAKVLHDRIGYQPRWSRDGKQIFYVTLPEEGENRFTKLFLASIPASGGTGDSIPTLSPSGEMIRHIGGQSGNRISPDGRWIISSAWLMSDTGTYKVNGSINRIWKISVTGNESIQITNEKGLFADGSPCWSPDGTEVAFVRVHFIEGKMDPYGDVDIFKINNTGDNSVLLNSISGNYVNSLTWSPDGKTLAYLTCEINEPHTKQLNLLDVKTHEIRIAGEVPSVHVNIEMAWSPDSKRIAFNDEEGKVIKIMNLEDGNIEDIETGLVDVSIYHLDWSPDGKKFVFGGYQGGDAEFWFLEDFLPLEKLPTEPANEQEQKSDALTIRQVWTGDYTDNCGNVSLDGEMLSFVDWETGNLAIRKLSSGKNEPLTSGGTWDDPMHFALINVISHDGKKIAYSWYNDKGTYDLKILNLEDRTSCTVYASDSLEEIYPVAWSCTDDAIIVQYFIPVKNSYNWQLSTLDLSNGELSPIKEFQIPYMTNLGLASDDAFLAYDYPNPIHQGRFDINLRKFNDDKDISLVNHPANDRVLGWIPDTDMFLFTSDRSGTTDIYAITIPESGNSTEPKRIMVNVGTIDPMGFTKEGSLYYSLSEQKFDSYIVPIDHVTGRILDDPKTPLLGSIGDVCWLPDGESMICVKLYQGPDNRPDYSLCFLNTITGELRDLANQIMVNGMPRLSPDLHSILFYGIDKSSLNEEVVRRGLFIADINTGNARFLQVKEDASSSYSAEWDAKGGSVFYTSNGRIIRHYLETGQEEVLYENPQLNIPTLRRSHDGENLIFDLQATEEEKFLVSIPVNGGKTNTFCKIPASGTPLMYKKIVLSPKGEYVYYTLDSPESGSVIWRIPSSGGDAEKMWFSKSRITGLSPHPDGNSIAISVYRQNQEIWVLENLLAELNKVSNPDE